MFTLLPSSTLFRSVCHAASGQGGGSAVRGSRRQRHAFGGAQIAERQEPALELSRSDVRSGRQTGGGEDHREPTAGASLGNCDDGDGAVDGQGESGRETRRERVCKTE